MGEDVEDRLDGGPAIWPAAGEGRDLEDEPVMSGVFHIGLGEQFDDAKLEAYPPGAVVVRPGGTPHFHWAKSGEYVTQVTAFGPISLEYVNPDDDPRNK